MSEGRSLSKADLLIGIRDGSSATAGMQEGSEEPELFAMMTGAGLESAQGGWTKLF